MVSKIETNPSDVDWAMLFGLMQSAFAYMADRIDPPSSLTRMNLDDVIAKAQVEDLFLVRRENTPIACLFGTPRADCYYIRKLAVAADQRGQGLAKALVERAAIRANGLGHHALELESRVELIENHAAFTRMGFVRSGESAHPGYTRATSYTFRRPLSFPQGASGL